MFSLQLSTPSVEAGQTVSATVVVSDAKKPIKIEKIHVWLESDYLGGFMHTVTTFPGDPNVPVHGDLVYLPITYTVPLDLYQSAPPSVPGLADLRFNYRLFAKIVKRSCFSSDKIVSVPITITKGPEATLIENQRRALDPLASQPEIQIAMLGRNKMRGLLRNRFRR